MRNKEVILARFVLLILLITVTIVGCVQSNLRQTSVSNVNTVTGSPTLTLSSTVRPSQKATLQPTETIDPTLTKEPSFTSTWTPRPTLPPEEAQKLIRELMVTNGKCQLPCWWGIMPGETSWQEAQAYLSTFATKINTLESSGYGVHFDHIRDSDGHKIGATILVENGIVERIRVVTYLSLDELLQTYGQPEEVWIFATAHIMMKPGGRFTLVVFYAHQGILAIYEGSTESTKILDICPSRIEGNHFGLLWSPALDLTFHDVGREALLFQSVPSELPEPYYLLGEVANIDIKTFYETYKDSSNAARCFQMPDQTWPENK